MKKLAKILKQRRNEMKTIIDFILKSETISEELKDALKTKGEK